MEACHRSRPLTVGCVRTLLAQVSASIFHVLSQFYGAFPAHVLAQHGAGIFYRTLIHNARHYHFVDL